MALTANQDWLYKQMTGRNVDLGSEEQFAQAMQDENNRQWVYEQAGKMGIDLGTPEQFASAMLPDVEATREPKEFGNIQAPAMQIPMLGNDATRQDQTRLTDYETRVPEEVKAHNEMVARKMEGLRPQHEALWTQDKPMIDEIYRQAEQDANTEYMRQAEAYSRVPFDANGSDISRSIAIQRAANEQRDPAKLISAFNARLDERLKERFPELKDTEPSTDKELAFQLGKTPEDYSLYKDYVMQQLQQYFTDVNMPKSQLEYLARKVIQGNIIGQLYEIGTKPLSMRQFEAQGLGQYAQQNETTGLDFAAEVANVALDLPLMAATGGVGGAAERGLTRLTTRQLARQLERRGMINAEQMAARIMAQNAWYRAGMGAVREGTMFSTLNTINAIGSDLFQEGKLTSRVPIAGAEGFITGAVMGGIRVPNNKFTSYLQDQYGRRTGTLVGAANSLTARTNIMVGGQALGAIMNGEDMDKFDWGNAYLHAGLMNMGFDFLGAGKLYIHNRASSPDFRTAINRTINQLQADPQAYIFSKEDIEKLNRAGVEGKDVREIVENILKTQPQDIANSFGFNPENMRDISKRTSEGFDTREIQNRLEQIFVNPDIDTEVKAKLYQIFTGQPLMAYALNTDVQVQQEDGKYVVRTYDNTGMTYRTRTFDNLNDAERYRQRQVAETRPRLLNWCENIAATSFRVQAHKQMTDEAVRQLAQEFNMSEVEVRQQLKTALDNTMNGKPTEQTQAIANRYAELMEDIENAVVLGKAVIGKQPTVDANGNPIQGDKNAVLNQEDVVRAYNELLKGERKKGFRTLFTKTFAKDRGLSEEKVHKILDSKYESLNEADREIYDDYVQELQKRIRPTVDRAEWTDTQEYQESQALNGATPTDGGEGTPAEPIVPEPLSPAAAEHQRAVDEVTQSVRERTHGNGYIYPVAMPGNAEKTGYIVGEVVPVIDDTNPEQLKIENDDVVTVKWSDGTVTQERARDLNLTGAPMMAQQAIDIEVKNQMYAYTQQRIQNGEQPVLMRNGEGILEGFFPTEGGLLEDQNGVQYTPEQLAEQGWQETKPVLFVNDTQQIAALDNGDGTYTQVDALGNPIAEPMSAEAFSEQGFAMVPLEEEKPKSQAPVEAPVVEQAPVETAPEVQQPEVQEPAAPVVPNIETMSAADYAGAAVEYMGSREYVDEYLDGEIKKVQQQLGVANSKKVGNVTDMADFKAKKDAIEAEKKALQTRLDKLTEAREKAKSYLTIAEREARAKAEAERRAAEEAMRIAREQAAAAEAARLEQERIDRELKKGVPDFSEDNDKDARARGFHVQNGYVIRRQEPLQPLATGKQVTVQFAKGDNGAAEAHHVLIPFTMAQPSHINGQRNPAFFISEAQPKDRRDQVSKVTSDMMAQNIHPDEIVEGATAYVGAPVLNARGEAVQGNNRLDALIKMYQSHPESVAKYKQYLIDNAVALGYTEADIETIRNNDVIDVRMLDNVTDEQAILLGQKKATDLETGGVQLIDPQVTANQLNREEGRLQRFAEILLNTNDEEATLADLTLRNGKQALDYLQKLGIINDAQAQSAFDSRGNITAEAKAALQGVLRQVVYTDSKNDNLSYIFDSLPVTAQKAILQTVIRDLDKKTPREAKLVPHIQEAIAALYDALGDEAVRNAKIEADVRRAMQSWASQIKISADSDAENLPGSEKFSNFARELATLFKYGKQTEIAKKLNAYYDAVQGTMDMFGETPAIPFKEAVELIFGIDYKSVDQVRREKHRKELADYLSTVADTAHPFELFGDDNFIDLLIKLGTSPQKIEFVRQQLAQGKTFEGFAIRGKLYLNADGLATTDKARSKYNHERQHTLTTKEQIERVMRAASRDDLDALVEALSESEGAYSNEAHDVLADEFISFAMEVAYDVDTDEELEAALQVKGANDELINIIKEINNEQRANDQRLGQSERLSNSRRHASVDADSEGRSPQGGRDSGQEPATVEQTGLRTPGSSTVGTGNGGTRESGTEGAGLSEVGAEGVSGEEAGGAATTTGNGGSNQAGAGVGQERGLGEVAQSPAENRETAETKAAEIEIGGALVDRLEDMGLSVSTDLQANRDALKEAKADKSEAGTIHYFKTPSGQQYGFSYKGKVYLDPTKINAELPLHEYGHLWAEALRRLNPENWQRVVETIKADKDAWAFVRELRPELTDENEIAEEVIATFSGKNGAEKMRAEYERMHGKDADYKSKWGNIFKNISKAIQDFWKAVGDFLNIKYTSAEQVYDQVLKDFVDNMNPWKRVSDYLQARDKEYVQAAESGDIKTATNLFYDALKENIGNGITPYMSVGTYTQLKRLAKGVKTRNEGVIKEAAAKIAPLIPDNAVLIPAPSHDGRATDMLDLAKAVAEITGSEVADVLRSAPRESQYQAKKATGVPMASGQLGITMEGTLPEGKTPIIIDNVVDSGNTAEACVQAVGRAVVVTIGDSAEQYRHAASLKSAAPVLRDKAGKVIPLSKRFEPKGSRYLGRRMYLSSNDPRFAISGTQVIPVTDKTLVGLHNISVEKLRKALKAGGLANPSAAVIDIARQDHHDYGNISLVLSSNMVENADGTYAGDAWTPMYPQVEYRQGKQTEKRIKALVKGLPKNLADGIYYRVGEYMDRNRNSSGLEYIFLKNKGEDMPILTNKRRYPDISIEDIYKRLGTEYPGYYDSSSFQAYEQLPADQLFEFNLWLEKYGREADIQRVKDKIAELREKGENKAADVLTERYSQPLFFNYYDSIGYRILRDERDAGEENIGETLDAADRKIDELGLRNEFEDWKQQMIDSFGYDEVLFAGWTSDGDRRYVKNTVENASRLMNKESETNYLDRQSVNETKAMLMDKLRTLSDIRKHKGQLEPDDEKIREAYEQASHDWGQLGIDFRDYTTNEDKTAYGLDDNPFTAIDTALARLQEAMFKRDPIAFLNREYRYSLPADSEFGTRLKEMVKRIKNLPSRYFETKFRRPVYLNEFANAVVPNDLPQDLRAGLESAGLRLFSYDPNTQGSRRDATLEATAGEGIRFSINGRGASTGSSKRSNRDIEALRQFESVRPEIAKEMESIKNNALNDGTFMKAPNGKPTNLDERQWLQVRTRAFKRWFGDWENDPENASKVLDENGEPMVVYHRTNNKFTQFDPDRAREQSGWPTADFGFYFSNVNERGHYGRKSMPVFLNIRNPREIDVDYYADFDYNYKHADPEEMRKDNDGLQINIGRLILDEKATKVFVTPNPNQIKSATNNNGDFSEENDDIRFSISNQNNDIFYSNAERAVEGIKQEKATPEQWRAMIEKAGGLKAGEDKWIGLSDWLAQQRPTVTPQEGETRSQFVERAAAENKRFTLSKQDLLDYIREHKIQIEEQEYGEYEEDALFLERKDEYKRYYDEAVEAGEEDPNEVAWDRMIEEYGDDFSLGYYAVGDELMRDNDSDYAQWEADSEGRPRAINETRLRYTTWGLENKREIALIVPDIEEWNEDDEIHFGDAGPGKAIAWVRFGDTGHTRSVYTDEEGKEHVVLGAEDVLVIDEIQSKRHQEGRDKGYYDGASSKELMRQMESAEKAYTDYLEGLREKYGVDRKPELFGKLNEEEAAEADRLNEAANNARRAWFASSKDAVPAAPFEKNWHELAMKRILRFAAENGYDKVAWTTGEQQAKRYDIGKEIDHIVKTDENTYEVYPTSGLMMTLEFDENGMYADEYDREYNGKSMSDIFGKDLAKRLKEMPVDETLQGDGLRVGYDGMKGFYDDILPRFMQKYGKKWGVQVGEVTMPDLEDGYQTMHSVDITDDMRRSVLEGQPMFSISGRRPTGTIAVQPNETRSQYIARVAETVKNMTPRNTSLDDAIRFSITVNHNSPYLLKKADGSFVDPETGERLGFDHRFMGKGEGNQAHGWGTYLSVNDLRDYAEARYSNRGKVNTYKGMQYDDVPKTLENFVPRMVLSELGGKEIALEMRGEPKEAKFRQAVAFVRAAIEHRTDEVYHGLLDDYYRAELADEPIDNVYSKVIRRNPQELADELLKQLDAISMSDFQLADRHHYSVEIPDNDGTNYIEERQPMNARARKAIMDGLIADGYTMEEKDNGEFGWYEFNKGDFREDPDNQISLLKEDETYGDFIHDNFHGYDSKMIARVSKYLSDAGVVGIHYDGRRDGECYVIFNPDDAVITDHIRFSVTSGKSVLPKTTDASQVEHPMRSTYNTNGDIVGDDQIRFSVNKDRRDREGFVIGNGDWHMPYEVREFPDYPQIKSQVSKASTTESVYVTYTNKNNGASVKVRFSGHMSNNARWGVDLPGFAAENGQILERLGLAKREWKGNSYVPVRSISKAELAAGNYEVADKTRAELSQLPIGTDISAYKGKLVPDMTNNAIYTSDKVVEDQYHGRRIYRDANGNIIPDGRNTDHIRFSVTNPSTLSRSETVTKALVQQANNNYNIMQSALKKVTADLKGIRAAMRMQSDYDRKVVDALLNLYNTLLQENGVWAQYMPDTTRRIATQIVHAIGKQNITEEVNTIMDHMVHAQAKAAQRQWDKLRQTPIDKINISGVVMQGKVALEGQHALKAMNDALQANMTIEQIEEQINQLMDMEDNATDESLKTQYKGQWIGLTIAAQHLERLQHLQEERQQLDLELQSARSNKALKPAARQQLVDNIKQAMRDNYIEQAEAYTRSTQDLSEYVNTQEGRAKDFIRRQDANRDKIRSYAQRDLEGLATNPNRNRTRGNVARSIWDAFASPIRDLQSLLRLTGLHAPDGEGYLYNHFMRNWMDGADMERTGIVAASKTLDEKIAELTHGKYKTWEEAARKIDDASHNMFTITMLNGVDGKDMPVTEEIPLNAGNALYIYAVNKMNDGRMKLNGMNITEEDVQALADKVREQFGQEILDVVDWVQSEFFSQLRNRYNPTHEALFGAPMDAIENYFPLRINANARQQNEDLSEPDTDAARLLAGTSTGAIKRRTRNSLPLDVRNADFFQEVIRHISQMERWNAFAQWNRDANILFSDINFRNRIKGMKGTIYGEGDKLYNYMKDAFRVAIGTYKPKTDTFSEITLNMAKGVTSAKINFRVFTALKQIASFPAFFTYMQDGVFVQSYLRNWLKPHETMKWAKENLPNFEKRVSKRDMGDMRLMQRSTDWQWNKRILEWSSKYGMFFNVFFDTLTCATGARAVYDARYAKYIGIGYTQDEAAAKARQDAEQSFNTSQQSSEGAFMAPVQMDRNLVTAALTVFRTSPIQYTRNGFAHARNLIRKYGRKDEMIAFRTGQYKNDGISEEKARQAAEKDFNKSIKADAVGVTVYFAILGIFWRLVGQVPYLLFGDDDDKKKEILKDAFSGGAFVQPITGLLGGGIIESALDGQGSIADMFAPEMPFTQDLKRASQYLANDKYAEFASQALSVLMQSGTGFDPQTAADMITRVVTTIDSEQELSAAEEALRISQALLSIPQSQYEQQLIDRVVADESEYDAALEDYIRYQKIHTAPLTWWLRGEESDEKAEENAEKRFNKLLTERDKLHNPEDYEE